MKQGRSPTPEDILADIQSLIQMWVGSTNVSPGVCDALCFSNGIEIILSQCIGFATR